MTPRVKLLPELAEDPLAAGPLAELPLLLQAVSAEPRMPTAAAAATRLRWLFRVDLTFISLLDVRGSGRGVVRCPMHPDACY
jgi:hypothetical protein